MTAATAAAAASAPGAGVGKTGRAASAVKVVNSPKKGSRRPANCRSIVGCGPAARHGDHGRGVPWCPGDTERHPTPRMG